MRVSCHTIIEFIECLQSIDSVFDDTIRFSTVSKPLGDNKAKAVRFEVVVQASTVVQCKESEYILEVGQVCGIDYHDASQELEGSEVAKAYKKAVEDVVDRKGWKILPGVINQ